MSVSIIPQGRSLIDEVLKHLEGKEKDYSSTAVIFPGKRPSHFLRKGLAMRVGTSFMPPAIFSMDEFIDSICERSGAGRKLETIDAVAVLYGIHRKAPTPLGGKGFMSAERFFSLGTKIYRDLEELAIEGIDPEAVRKVESLIAEGLPEQTKGRLQSLSHFYENFYGELRDLGFSSRSMRYQIAAGRIDDSTFEKYEKIVFAGFFALTNAERIMFRKLLPLDNTVFIFQRGRGLKENLLDFGIPCETAEDNADVPDIRFYASPDTHGQAMALGNVLGSRFGEGEPLDEKTVVVLPSSESLFPLLHQGLSFLTEDAYNVSLGYPLHRTPVFGFLNNLMELVSSMDGDRVYIPDYLKFVLHPYTKNIYFRGKSETTRILFHSIEEELIKHRAKRFVLLKDLEENDSLFREIIGNIAGDEEGVTVGGLREHLKDIHDNTVGRFLSFEDIGDFAGKCIDVLLYIFNGSTARLHPLFEPFAKSFLTSLDLLTRSLMKDVAFAERAGYFVFLRRYVMTCHIPFAGTPLKGLQVLGLLETRNLKFDRVFVLDANEEVLPDTRKEETLLPLKARQTLGLPTYIDRDRLTSYYFEALLKGAKDVHLFFIDNDKKEPSRFVQKLLWERQKKDRQTDSTPYITPIQYQVRLVNKTPDPISKSREMIPFLRNHHYSATTLNQYLKCPLQFYYLSVLGLRPRDEITGDIERDDLGILVHDMLRLFLINKRGRTLTEADFRAGEMDSIAEALFEKKYGKEPVGELYLLKRQVKRRMGEVVSDYYLPLAKKNALTILEVEESVATRVNGFNLKGRLDSVEQRGEKTVIVDFKTGASENYLRINLEKLDVSERGTWNDAIGSLQLPFYLILYTEKKRVPIDALNALFLLLGRSSVSEDAELHLFDGASPAETFVPLRTVIFKLLEEITDPSVPFSPAGDLRRTCPSCDFKYVCGTSWVVK
jgi:ATP-dependent helicase/nuclease subunit B